MSQLNERLDATQTRVLAAGKEIAVLLSEDLAGYPDRELQRRFMAEAEIAESISDPALAALRKAAKALGTRSAEAISTRLAADEPWLALPRSDTEIPDSKDLRAVPAVWALVCEFDAEVTGLAATVGLEADDRTPPGYAPPRRFIGRRYLPSLVENYLRACTDLRELLVASEEAQVQSRKQSLAERWAAANGNNP
ncbi:MAG: hypothetical protein KC502_06590 [Myxococcales bacterium]|nr:hypothetical protein [Myxococcales bacterium]